MLRNRQRLHARHHEWVTAVFDDFGVEKSEVVGDQVIALDAAFKGGPGILQIAGTGSNTIGRAPDGSIESAGGWSSRLGDEGSGYWIGLHSVRRALRAYDRGEPTQVLKKVGEIWGTPDLDELVNLGDGTPGPDFAALAPAIYELAQAGDPVAVGVLNQAAADLVDFVLLVRAKLKKKHNIAGEVPVAWTGGVVEKMTTVREAFFKGLRDAAPNLPIQDKVRCSLEGAVWRAQRLAELLTRQAQSPVCRSTIAAKQLACLRRARRDSQADQRRVNRHCFQRPTIAAGFAVSIGKASSRGAAVYFIKFIKARSRVSTLPASLPRAVALPSAT